MSHKYPGIRKERFFFVPKMLEAAFSVEWLAQSSRNSKKGQDEYGRVFRSGQAARHSDFCATERSLGKVTARSTEESGRSLASDSQGAKSQQRSLAIRARPACNSRSASGGTDTEPSGSGEWADRRRLRTIFTAEQVRMLESSFERQQYPGTFVRRSLAGELRLSETQVKTWFQNRRMKLKQQLQVAQAEALKSRLFLQYFSHPYHSAHSFPYVVDSSYLPHYPDFGPHPTQTPISNHHLQCLDHQSNLPPSSGHY